MENMWEKGSQKVICKLQTKIQSQKDKKERKKIKHKKEQKGKKPKRAKKLKRNLAVELQLLRQEFHAFQAAEDAAMRERHRKLWHNQAPSQHQKPYDKII